MKLVKLTRCDGTSGDIYHGQLLTWGPDVTHCIEESFKKPYLCTNGVIHAYDHPLIAYCRKDTDLDWATHKYWLAEGELIVREMGKIGVYELTTIREIPAPSEENIENLIHCLWLYLLNKRGSLNQGIECINMYRNGQRYFTGNLPLTTFWVEALRDMKPVMLISYMGINCLSLIKQWSPDWESGNYFDFDKVLEEIKC